MKDILSILQIIITIFLIISILLQQKGSSLGSAFGGGDAGFYATQRGIQKKIFFLTIILGILFISLSLLNLVLNNNL